MPFNSSRVREHLRSFDLRHLFIEELGWDHHVGSLDVMIDGHSYVLQAIAQKRGLVVYRLSGKVPEYSARGKIERQVGKSAHEHLIIYTNLDNSLQLWQWVKREPGKPMQRCEHAYHRNQPGDALVQKLQDLVFTIEEEEQITIVEVAGRIRAAFDVERVTKRFYDEFRKQHAVFLKFISGIPVREDREWYAPVMLNRLMFIYFIQKKGFLDGDPNYLRNRLVRTKQEFGKDKFYSFYSYFLLRLFHQGLGSRERTPKLEKLLGRVPYLNGGLFNIHELESPDRYGKAIEIPDNAFEEIFDYFDRWHWHLDERPLRNDNEINPAVLGYIFEKYINQKQMGAYYTQEDITEYISKNTILPFLFDATRAKCTDAFENPNGPTVWDLLHDDPDQYIYPAVRHSLSWSYDPQYPNEGKPLDQPLELPTDIAGGLNDVSRRGSWNGLAPTEFALPTEIWRDVIARRKRHEELKAKLARGEVRDINDLITYNINIRQFAQDVIENCEGPELLRAFWHAIENITILDPTCGSGAFLFAALNVLEPLYEACLDRMAAFLEELDRSSEKHQLDEFSDFQKVLANVAAHPNRPYFIFKSIILNNLFGVDIMEEAVEICKLRLLLKLAAQVEPNATKDNFGIEQLPDIDFNIRAGNTLVGFATAEGVRRAFKEDRAGAQTQVKFLLGETSDAYQRFEEQVELADRAFNRFRDMQTEKAMDAKSLFDAKQTLRNSLKSLGEELSRHLAGEYGVKVAALAGGKSKSENDAYSRWLKSHLPFHWFLEFFGIISNGGFAVIIGNPPYVELSDVARQYSVRDLVLAETGNLYAVCVERFSDLLHEKGRLGVIVPISSISTSRMQPLMRLLHGKFSPLHLSNFAVRPGKLFVGVDMNLTIVVGQRAQARSTSTLLSTAYNRWVEQARPVLFEALEYSTTTMLERSSTIPKLGSSIAGAIFNQIDKHGSLARLRTEARGSEQLFYHSGGRYFRKCLRDQPSNEYKALSVRKGAGDAVICLLSSSFYYWFWIAISDCYHVTKRDIDALPVPESLLMDNRMHDLAERLLRDLWKHAEKRVRSRADGSRREEINFYVGESKPILDEIDTVLGEHYGFTGEKLDFILNYDIKYRFRPEEL
jgi:hypothetical protein